MKKSVLVFLALLIAYPVVASAQTHYRPYYQERPLVGSVVPTYPYFLSNETGAPLTVYLYVDGVRWEFAISPEHEVSEVMLPHGATVKPPLGLADIGSNKGVKRKKVLCAYFFRDNDKRQIERGWVFYR